MKRILAILLALMLVFAALTACDAPEMIVPGDEAGSGNDGDEATGDDADGPSGTLKVWYDNDERFEDLQRRFNAVYPNITIEYERVAHTDARGRLGLDGPAGIGADVFMLPHDHLGNAILDGLIEPLDADLQALLEATLSESAVRTVTKDGKMYAVPVVVENIALFYNKDLWGETPPTTMEEILAFAEEYNNPATGQWAMGWQIEDAYHNYHWMSAFGMEFMGPNQDDYTNPGFDSPGALEGIRYMVHLRENLFNVPSGDGTYASTVAEFQNGNLPLTISGPWAIADAINNEINFGITKLPTIGGRQPICFHGLRTAVMSSYTQVPHLALLWLEFLASAEGAAFFYNTEGMLPAFRDQSQVPGLRDDAYLAGIMEQNPYSIPMPLIPQLNQGGWDGLQDLFVFAWNGDLTPEESQDKAMDTYKMLLQAAGNDIDW